MLPGETVCAAPRPPRSVHGLRSYLHVSTANHNAIALHHRLGFTVSGQVLLCRITRTRQSDTLPA